MDKARKKDANFNLFDFFDSSEDDSCESSSDGDR